MLVVVAHHISLKCRFRLGAGLGHCGTTEKGDWE
jgi:hypothetical protein